MPKTNRELKIKKCLQNLITFTAPSVWKPDPTIRIRIETETAEVVENAMPRWADLSSRPWAN